MYIKLYTQYYYNYVHQCTSHYTHIIVPYYMITYYTSHMGGGVQQSSYFTLLHPNRTAIDTYKAGPVD